MNLNYRMFKIVITILVVWRAAAKNTPVPLDVDMQLPPLDTSLKENNSVDVDITVL